MTIFKFSTSFFYSLLFIFLSSNVLSQDWEWVVSEGGVGEDSKYSADVITDSSGNVYVTGSFEATATFCNTSVTAYGGEDIFIAKYDSQGSCLWFVNAGGGTNDRGYAIDIDLNGHLIVTGHFDGLATFGTHQVVSSGGSDIFIAKYNSTNGDCIWVNHAGGSNSGSVEKGLGVTSDELGNVYGTGVFSGTAQFGTTTLLQGGVYVVKYDENGNFIWAIQSENSSLNDSGNAIHYLDSGILYITGGFFSSGITFGSDTLSGYGNHDIFLAKLDTDGNFIWAKKVGAGSSTDFGNDLCFDPNGNVYITGYYINSGIFDDNPSVPSQPFNNSNVFITKYNSDGTLIWLSTVPGTSFNGQSEGIDYSPFLNELVITGHFGGTSSFGSFDLTSAGYGDIFVARYDTTGICLSAQKASSSSWIRGRGVAYDTIGNIYVAGNIEGTTTFDTLDIQSEGESDFFLAKINTSFCPSSYDTLIISECVEYELNGTTYTQSGAYNITLQNVNDCDSLVHLDLTILNPTYFTDAIISCDSYTWLDGNTYTTSNNSATDTLINSDGCDSIITLDLTILNESSGTDVINVCDSITWVDGNTYTTSNNSATHTLINSNGCDSTVTLDLTINSVNVETVLNDLTITANNPNGTYQWIDCDNNTLISGETNQSLNVTSNGSYAVIVSENGCQDTSDCVIISTVSYETLSMLNRIKIIPNPTNGVFQIISPEKLVGSKITLTNALGQIIKTNYINNSGVYVDISEFDSGVYFLRVQSSEKVISKKILKR
ncbi:MAG: T9SS type A sorting domain-containing protein [Brumimicrobium sp.]